MDGEQKLVVVRSFATAEEAHAFRNWLESEDIRAYIGDEATVGWFWHLGNALGGIKVQVAEDDLPRVKELMESEPPSAEALHVEDDLASEEADSDCLAEEVGASLSSASVGEAERSSSPTEDDDSTSVQGDRLAARALRAAIFGLLACPPVLPLYSLWVLLQLGLSSHEISSAGKRQQLVAFLLDLAVIFLVVDLLLWYF